MNTAKHTLGPWAIQHKVSGGIRISHMVKTHTETRFIPVAAVTMEADAAFIVQACNSHETLVDTLQQVEVAFRHFKGCNLAVELPGLYTVIREALAQAEGKDHK